MPRCPHSTFYWRVTFESMGGNAYIVNYEDCPLIALRNSSYPGAFVLV